MASFLPIECLEKIFLYLPNRIYGIPTDSFRKEISTKDLYYCTLVSKHWCRVSTPILYAYPFPSYSSYCRNPSADLAFSYIRLLRTLLSCTPKSEIEQMILSDSSNPTFNYISFIRGLNFDLEILEKLNNHKSLWLPLFVLNNIKKNQIPKISSLILNHLAKTLSTHCNNNLTRLEIVFTNDNIKLFNNIVEPLTINYCDERSKLTKLKELYYINNYDSKIDLYSAFSNKVRNLNLLHNEGNDSIKKANSLSHFISLQKKLQHIILSEFPMDNDNGDYYNIVFESLTTQSENLQILNLKNIPFDKINGNVLNSLCSLKNIKELRLNCCIGIGNNLIPWAEHLRKLEVFEFSTYDDGFENFLNQLIQSSSTTLNKLIINYERTNERDCQSLLKQIPLHLKSLIHLDLTGIYPDELILIFKLCTQLVYLSTTLTNDISWTGIKFKNLGESIPKNLQKIQFKDVFDPVFKVNYLECFFEECLNNNSKLKYLEIVGSHKIDQKYFDVANKFGIQLIDKSDT
ncbi:unnamed protein product [Rhizophagus irregularis]|uniref:Uncharacterized protein n=1 Tax=Rhizophagus irregularis TaxID=588596 RepID=A0A2I1HH68_9GLOM|nr:hypothetical protein RhiirA4_511934 [Rhizophagus irregularis]CAB4427498.1 unnamed protein product [Rhizophagus irregularis]